MKTDILKQKFNTSLELKERADGTYLDQYGRVLAAYTNEKGKPDLRPTGAVAAR